MNKTHFLQMRVDLDFLRLLDDIRRHEDDLPTRTQLVRRLIVEAILARKRARSKAMMRKVA